MAVLNKNLAGSFGNGGFLVNDNPNVWKARSEGAMLSEKAYGNPQMNPAEASKFADQTFKGDPWYALGKMIGAGYMQNYNERGINKNVEAAENAIKGAYGDINDMAGQPQPQVPQAVEQPIQQSDNVRSDWGSGYTPRTDMTNPVVPVRDQIKQDKLDYRVAKYADSPNPTSEGIEKANAEAQAKAETERINGLRKLDPVMMYNLGADAIKKRGGTKYQQDMALAQLRDQIGGYMATANKQIFDYDSKDVEDMINNGDYKGAWGKWASLAKLDPDRAKILYAGVPTMKEIWANDNQQKMMAARMAGYGGGRYGGYNNGSRKTSSRSGSSNDKAVGSPVKMTDFNALLKARDSLMTQENLSQEDQNTLKNINYQISKMSGLLGEGRKLDAPNNIYINNVGSAEYDNDGNLLRYSDSKSISDILEESKVYNNPADRLAWINQNYPDVYRYMYENGKTVNDYK